MTLTQIRALVVDDEPLARRRIIELLDAESGIEVVGYCENGREAIEAIRALHPDLVFLDVQMPEVDGFGVVEAIGADRIPAVVFVSAHEEFALRAFDASALDYLLKPFEDERFQATLSRVRAALNRRDESHDPRIDVLLHLLQQSRKQYPSLIAIKVGDVYQVEEVSEIDWVEADGNYVRLRLDKAERVLHRTLTELEDRLLDPSRFVRIHRSTIINLSRVAAVEPRSAGELTVLMKNGMRLICSRRFRAAFQERVQFLS